MAYNETHVAKLKDLVSLATKTKNAIEAAIADLPTEQFLDQAKTQFVSNFAFNAETYAGATNPDLDGKPVLVLAVKGVNNKTKAETLTYLFLNMKTLVDTYTAKAGASAQILNINSYEIEVKFDSTLTTSANGLGVAVSAVANNAITKQTDGLHVDISGKADKVTSATAGHVAGLDANGNLTDSGIAAADIITTADLTTDAEVEEALTGVFGAQSQSLTLKILHRQS